MRLSVLGLLACIAISFTACEKNSTLTPNGLEDSNTTAKLSTVIESDEDRDRKGSCLEFSGEVTYLLPDGTSVTGEQSEAKAEVKAWYAANPDAGEKATLQFPVDIILEDETLSTINSRKELVGAKAACKGDRGNHTNGSLRGNKCFKINGEVTYLLPDGTSVTGERRAVKKEIKAWYEANPDAEERATLQFPVEIIFEDETVSTINSRKELIAAKAACKGERGNHTNGGLRGNKCFKINGEVTYLLPDGTSVTGERRAVKKEIKAWYEANPDSEERATLQFPVEIIFEDQSVITVNSREELMAAKAACQD